MRLRNTGNRLNLRTLNCKRSNMAIDRRREYMTRGLGEEQADPDPFQQFRKWLEEAAAAENPEPNAMTLATAGESGRPSARMVLLRGLDERGFVFYTNYESRKGKELAQNPWASLVFFWAECSRQVRVEGRIEKVSERESDDYFARRPRDTQIGAWASNQSQVIANRRVLEQRVQEFAAEFAGPVPRPPHWGGYRLRPD